MIKAVFNRPSALKESRINIVEIRKPEFLITVLNLSVCKKENSSNNTSVRMRMVKNSLKKMLLTSFRESTIWLMEKKLS